MQVVFQRPQRVIKGTRGKTDTAKFQKYLVYLSNYRLNWGARLGQGLKLGPEGLVDTERVTRWQTREEDLTVIPH